MTTTNSENASASDKENAGAQERIDDESDAEDSQPPEADAATDGCAGVADEETGDPQTSADDPVNLDRDALIDQLHAAREEIDAMQEGYIRARAEIENVRRRSQNEMVSARKFAIEGFARELLSVVDSLDQATKVQLDDAQGEAVVNMRQGLELTVKQLTSVMEKFGINPVDAQPGTRFDPEVHQAISAMASEEIESEHVIDVMQKGFTLKERLLRPAMVVISSGPAG